MKPLLSELFLPCSGKHSPMRANRYPLTTITGAQRASGQTHSRARSHQDGADLRADRSTAYLVSCIRVCSAHGNSLLDSHELESFSHIAAIFPPAVLKVRPPAAREVLGRGATTTFPHHKIADA